MSLLHESIQEKKFDVRVVEKNLTRNVTTEKDLKAHLDALKDDSENANYISLEEIDDTIY